MKFYRMRRCPEKRLLRSRDWVEASQKRPTLTPTVLSRIRICSAMHKHGAFVSHLTLSTNFLWIHYIQSRTYRMERIYIYSYTASRTIGTRNNDRRNQFKKQSCSHILSISPGHELPKWPRARLAIGDDISSTPTPRNIRPVSSPPTRHATLFSTASQHTSSLVFL